MAKTSESHISKADYSTMKGYLLRWTSDKADGSRSSKSELFSYGKYGSWSKAFAAAKARKQELIAVGELDLSGKRATRSRRQPKSRAALVPSDTRAETLVGAVDAAEKAGVRTLSQLKAFLLFAAYEGHAQVQLAESGVFPSNTAVRSAYRQIGPGMRGTARKRKPPLIKSGQGGAVSGPAVGNEHLAKPVKLTAQGRRLLERLLAAPE